MSEENDLLRQLNERISALGKREEEFREEIVKLRSDLERLAAGKAPAAEIKQAVTPPPPPGPRPVKKRSERQLKADIERFIGENLINKIGIVVTVIGVGIGTKYAIDHQLISPLTRIILGYLAGICLLLFSLKLKKGYGNFSAVLLAGSMAIMYFITYAAFAFYHLYPRIPAFILMVLFTVATVSAALAYNRQIIAVGGLVGAFAVPFLLNEGAPNVLVFLAYVAIINTGILVIAFRKYWKPLYISAFGLTWLIYFTWYFNSYDPGRYFAHALVFLMVFFTIFYLTLLSYKLIKREKFVLFDIVLLLSNSFIFFGLGYAIIHGRGLYNDTLGLFCLFNAIIHALVGIVIFRSRLSDRNLFFMVSGLGIVFLTIAIPVQLSGNWVTLLWICEAAVLFGIGRMRQTPVYENISYALMLISFLSLSDDWSRILREAAYTDPPASFTPVLNTGFLTSLVVIGALLVIVLISLDKKFPSPFTEQDVLKKLSDYGLPSLFLLVLFLSFRTEIQAFYNNLSALNGILREKDLGSSLLTDDIESFRKIWLTSYSMVFLGITLLVLSFVPQLRLPGLLILWLSVLALALFLFRNLYLFSELRESYLANPGEGRGLNINISIRYISFIFAGFLLAAMKTWPGKEKYETFFRLLFHLTVLWILCSELLNVMDLSGLRHSYRFGLSILAGTYAFLLIVLGIKDKKAYLRISAIVLLGATLAKLFFYDITRLDTILKTLLFIILGGLLLVVSFLYNKYKVQIFGAEEKEEDR